MRWLTAKERRELDAKAAAERARNKPKPTNFQRLTASPEMLASVLVPLMPTMEVICPSGRHWKGGACDVNPNWKCEECMLDWLQQPAEEE